MRRRLVPMLLLVVSAAVACNPAPAGPTGPDAPDQVTPDDAIKATGARSAADAFVQAYASDTTSSVGALQALAGTALLKSWVHWLSVQNREFPGAITGNVSNDQIGPAAPFAVTTVPGSDAILRQVDVRATVTFTLRPDTGQPFSAIRSLDGPMRLILDPSGGWKVLDFTRDGIPLSREFEIVQGGTASDRGVHMTMAAFFSAPYWEFGLVVSSDATLGVVRKSTTLLDANGKLVASAQAVTSSIERIPAGSAVEGIVTFAPQASATGLTLRVVLKGKAGSSVVEFPLGNLIHPVALTNPTSPAPSPAG